MRAVGLDGPLERRVFQATMTEARSALGDGLRRPLERVAIQIASLRGLLRALERPGFQRGTLGALNR